MFLEKKLTCYVLYFSGTVSSSDMRKYPRRLYEVGKTPVQSRSMNHSCYLSNIQTVREELGEDVWSELRESAIGVIVKLKELNYCYSEREKGKTVYLS